MRTRALGAGGPVVSEIGLGAMGMSGMYGPADRDESIATIHAALDAGIDLIDTGDFYGMGHNELLIARRRRGTSARAHRASRARTSTTTSRWSRRCARSPTARG
jgi:aryl-alcohol dehydrogenase-like predicted oxidoreductase